MWWKISTEKENDHSVPKYEFKHHLIKMLKALIFMLILSRNYVCRVYPITRE